MLRLEYSPMGRWLEAINEVPSDGKPQHTRLLLCHKRLRFRPFETNFPELILHVTHVGGEKIYTDTPDRRSNPGLSSALPLSY